MDTNKQNLFEGKNFTLAEKIDNLESLAYQKEIKTFVKNFTPEEQEHNQAKYFEILTQKELIDSEFEEQKSTYKSKSQIVDKQIRSLKDYIKHKGYYATETVYLIDDQANNLMHTYDQNGTLINSRPLMNNEKQLSVQFIKQAAN